MEISKYRQMYAWLTRPGYNKGGRINFSSGSPSRLAAIAEEVGIDPNKPVGDFTSGERKSLNDALKQARTEFKGKVHNTIQEAVDSNKKIMKELAPSVKETMVEKKLRKYGKTDKKPYIPAEKLEATIVEEFQNKFPDKKIKLSIKDATYSD